MIYSARGANAPGAFRTADALTHSPFEPAAMGAAGDLARADKDRSCDEARFETPWQDRETLLSPAL